MLAQSMRLHSLIHTHATQALAFEALRVYSVYGTKASASSSGVPMRKQRLKSALLRETIAGARAQP